MNLTRGNGDDVDNFKIKGNFFQMTETERHKDKFIHFEPSAQADFHITRTKTPARKYEKRRADMVEQVYPMGIPCCECASTHTPAVRINNMWNQLQLEISEILCLIISKYL